MFAADHHLVVLSDNHLARKIVLRRHDINGFVGIHGHNACAGEFFGHVCADYFHAVHADNGIHDGIVVVVLGHGPGSLHSLALPALHGIQFNIVIDMGIGRCKMSVYNLKVNIGKSLGSDLYIRLHCFLLLMVADDRRPDPASHDYYIIRKGVLSVKLVIFTNKNIKPY